MIKNVKAGFRFIRNTRANEQAIGSNEPVAELFAEQLNQIQLLNEFVGCHLFKRPERLNWRRSVFSQLSSLTFLVFPFIVECFLVIGQCIISRIKRRIQNPVKRLRWTFSRRYLTFFDCYLLVRKAPSKMFHRVLNTSLEYCYFVQLDVSELYASDFY